ncbi:MAG: DbpA RNA binding domain-containing protein [Bacilli bacterium]
MKTKEDILDVMKDMLAQDLTEYKDAITAKADELKNGTDAIDYESLAAALLKYSESIKAKADKKEEKASNPDAEAADDSTSTVQRFFINLGDADGLDAESLKDFVCENFKSVVKEDFTDSYVKDTFSFFELPKTKIEGLIDAFSGVKFHDRDVHVELSEKKPQRGGRRGGFGGGRGRGGFGGGRGGYGHSDRGGFGRGGYGHSDRGGYGHSDRGGYGDRDRGGYSDRGGYGRGGDDDRGGYGRGGYGRGGNDDGYRD